MEYKVETVHEKPRIIAAVRRQTTYPQLPKTIISSLDLVYAFFKTGKAAASGQNIVAYWDDALTIESGVEVSAEFEGDGTVICSHIPGGNTLTTAHFGPYTELGAAHAAVQQWAAKNEKKLIRPCWELYGHWNDDPAKVRTDVFYLLA